jgi:hypothetical protein
VHIGHRPNHLILYVSLSFSHLFPKLCDLTWYQSYKLMPAFDQVPFFFFYGSFILLHLQSKLKSKCPQISIVCQFFFLSFLILYPSYFNSLHTPTWVSLCQNGMLHCHCFLYQQILPTQFFLVEKRKQNAQSHAHNWPTSGHNSQFRPKLSMSKFCHSNRCWPKSSMSNYWP